MGLRKVPWKRNFAKVPTKIGEAVAAIETDLIIVAQTKMVKLADIDAGVYSHLGLRREAGTLEIKPSVLPPANLGKFSQRNRVGWEKKRTDLPKIKRTYTWETPNFGDAATYGTHMHSQEREVYQREIFEPQHHAITIEALSEPTADSVLIKFSVDHILDRKHARFADNLLHCINLLQENTGVTGVFASTATRKEFIGTLALDWEIFPPGTASEVIAAITKSGKGPRPNGVMEERVKLFAKLKPTRFMRGVGGFGSYVGAQFADDLVVFENVNYGNALYVLFEDWAEVSRRSRSDLLKGTTESYERFLHTDGWEDRFEEFMKIEIKKRRSPRR
jgi:hypothetical protein